MSEEKVMPDFTEVEHLKSLDSIRNDGRINMFGAAVNLNEEYPGLSRKKARSILAYWMENFDEGWWRDEN